MAYVLTSISGNLISAASAGWAPTNSADMSAIASAYVESGVSSKQDTLTFAYDNDKISAINGSALAGQGGGGLVTAIGTSESGITSINNSGLVDTAALHSADYSSLYVQEPLYISASGDSSYIGISGDIGGVDSATCSAIASSYAESAASGKQDTSAMSSYALSADVSGVIDTVSSNSASWAGGITGDYLTAKVGSGQATFTTAFQDDMEKRPSLVIAAERSAGAKMYPRMMVTDWNGTTGDTHSGMLLANAFEFYICPQTARGQVDPSGVVQSRLDASQLQFNVDDAVSSFTRSSEFTRSGMRLGLSGKSASWVTISGNGNSGGFVTLDDGSGTSGRIVASSIPYWDGKLDGSASSSFYTTANESGYVNSAYVESQVSSKQDTLTFDWDADSAISSINGSALAGQGGGGGASIPFTGYYYDSATSATIAITADVSSVGSVAYKTYNGNYFNTYSGITDTLGLIHLGVASFISPGAEINGRNNGNIPYTMAFAPATSMWTTAGVATGIFAPLQYGTGAGMFLDNNIFKGYLKGNEWFVANTAYGYARGEVHQSRGCRVIVEHTGGAGAALSAKNADANVTLNNGKYYGTAKMAVANSQAYVQVQRGNSAYKYNSAKLDTDYLKFYNGMTTGYLDPEDTASGTAYIPAETEYMYISSIPYWNGKADSSALSSYALSADVSGTVDLVSTQSANWGGSALALSAGPGVRLEKVGDTLVAGLDETVLWSGSGNAFTTPEPITNFSEIKFHIKSHPSANVCEVVVPMVDNNRTAIKLSWVDDWSKGTDWLGGLHWWSNLNNTGMTSFGIGDTYYMGLRNATTVGGGSYGSNIYVLNVIGISRTAEA